MTHGANLSLRNYYIALNYFSKHVSRVHIMNLCVCYVFPLNQGRELFSNLKHDLLLAKCIHRKSRSHYNHM